MPMKSVNISPVHVIAGFLGSGKTTLLKRALARELDRGVKPAVLMNEFGEVDVDGALLHAHPRSKDIDLQALLSGCICCDLSGEFSEKVEHLVKAANGAPVFIETTGLADTGQVVMGVEKALAGSPSGKPRGKLASVVVMVDAPHFGKLRSYWAGSEHHLVHADTVVLNKVDQVKPGQADLVQRQIVAVHPRVRILKAVHANVEIGQLFQARKANRRRHTMNAEIKDSAAGYQSASFKLMRRVHPERLEAWLRRFQRSVIRLKGFVRVEGETGFQEIQWIMGSLAMTPYSGSKQSQSKLVVIGRRIPWELFLGGLERCLVTPKRQGKR
jgi:G3E family GTPase